MIKPLKIALIGYGKMGKTIEKIANARGHLISHKIDTEHQTNLADLNDQTVDVAIEFTNPESAYGNVKFCIQNQIPVVCGTTGWLQQKAELDALCAAENSAFFYASNFSIGVHIFFKINELLAKLTKERRYDVKIDEVHHLEKKDTPSGTAITLAEGIFAHHSHKTQWILEAEPAHNELFINALREPNVVGTHTVSFLSDVDRIDITHTAHTRDGFATGAIVAAEWLIGKKGIFGMNDLI